MNTQAVIISKEHYFRMSHSQFSELEPLTPTSVSTVWLFGLFVALDSTASCATTLEEQTKSLEKKVQTVEQRRKAALQDLNVNVLHAYRDAIRIDSVETEIAEVFDRTARVRVVVSYSLDFESAKSVRSSLAQYFSTNTDKVKGVEPYGMVYTNFDDCVGAFCSVKKETSRFLKNSAVGINVSFLGQWSPGILMDGNGRYDLKPGQFTFLIDVPKSKIKGDPKPVVKDAPINLPHVRGKSKFPRYSSLFAENGPMYRVLRAFPPGSPC